MYSPPIINSEPIRNFKSNRLGALSGFPAWAALRCVRSLAVMNVATKVTQLTIGTAIDRSDLATKKLLNIDAP